MVVDDFNVMRAIVMPCKTDTPLVIDSDAKLSLAVTAEGFEPVAGQEPECFDGVGGIKDAQSLLRLSAKGLKNAGTFPLMQFFGFFVLEAFDHKPIIPLVRVTSKVFLLKPELGQTETGMVPRKKPLLFDKIVREG
jgi:hypothetical protein